jgi:hypothetical protein
MAPPADPGLPEDLERSIAELGRGLSSGPAGGLLESCLAGLAALPAGSVSQVAFRIARTPGFRRWEPAAPTGLSRLLGHTWTPQRLLGADPRYAWLFVFHADGRVRECALTAIPAPPSSAFQFAALALRLNDWVGQVRTVAVAAAQRTFAATDAEVAAAAAAELLTRLESWGRWGDERAALDAAFGRGDVLRSLAVRLQGSTAGPLPTTLRQALRYPGIDAHLEALALQAATPGVRATALDALVRGRAAWTTGYSWEWIDKTYGVRRRVPQLEIRELTVNGAPEPLIRLGLADHSAVVRKVAAAALVEVRETLLDADELIARLARDPSGAVRMRADYMLRHPLPQN